MIIAKFILVTLFFSYSFGLGKLQHGVGKLLIVLKIGEINIGKETECYLAFFFLLFCSLIGMLSSSKC